MKNLKVKWMLPQAKTVAYDSAAQRYLYLRKNMFYMTGSYETELDAVKQIGGIAELPKPKCVLEIYFVILLLSNNAS